MKLQQEVQGQLRDSRALGWLSRDQEHNCCSIHPVAGDEWYNPADQYLAPSLCHPQNLGILVMISSTQHQTCWQWMG